VAGGDRRHSQHFVLGGGCRSCCTVITGATSSFLPTRRPCSLSASNGLGPRSRAGGDLWEIPPNQTKEIPATELTGRTRHRTRCYCGRRQRVSYFDSPTRCIRNTRNNLQSPATGVPRETISKGVLPPLPRVGTPAFGEGVYSERRPQRRVNTQLSNLFAATRPLSSIRLAVSEKASRIRPVGRAVTAPTPDHGDEADGEFDDEPEAAASSAGGTAAGAGAVDPRPAMARLASVGPPPRASSIIPSNRPRIETPRRAASASTQARRSWSRRMPTTVDLEVAMAPLTVIRAVYISGAEWWQPGGGRCGREQLGSGQARLGGGSRSLLASPESGPLPDLMGVPLR
jgi:hypothetical protein